MEIKENENVDNLDSPPPIVMNEAQRVETGDYLIGKVNLAEILNMRVQSRLL